MSLSVHFHSATDGDDGPFQLASAGGWNLFCQWAESLPDDFEFLHDLCSDGQVEDSAALSHDLNRAIDTRKPKNGDVLDTAEKFAEILGVGDSDEVVSVLDDSAEVESNSSSPLREGEEAEADDDTQERAEAMADLLLSLYGDDAHAMFDQLGGGSLQESYRLTEATWNKDDHPRGKDGRFIQKNSAEAVSAAKEKIHAALKQPKSKEGLAELMQHLNILSVKQIHELRKEHGISAGGKNRDELVRKIADRLDKGRRGETGDLGGEHPSYDDWAKGERAKNSGEKKSGVEGATHFHGTYKEVVDDILKNGLRPSEGGTAGPGVYLADSSTDAMYERAGHAEGVKKFGRQPDTLIGVKVKGKLWDAGSQKTTGGKKDKGRWSLYLRPNALAADEVLGNLKYAFTAFADPAEFAAKMKEAGYVGIKWTFADGRTGTVVFDPADIEVTGAESTDSSKGELEKNKKGEAPTVSDNAGSGEQVSDKPKEPEKAAGGEKATKDKEPWEMSPVEFMKQKSGTGATGETLQAYKDLHKMIVQGALAAGKDVPQSVRDAYPDTAQIDAARKRKPKEPWEMSLGDYTGNHQDAIAMGSKWAVEQHRAAVESALAAGKPVPPEVLADYPDLAKSAQGEKAKGPVDKSPASPPTPSDGAKPEKKPRDFVTAGYNDEHRIDAYDKSEAKNLPNESDVYRTVHDTSKAPDRLGMSGQLDKIWKAVQKSHPEVSREDFHKQLIQWSKDGKIALQKNVDHTRVDKDLAEASLNLAPNSPTDVAAVGTFSWLHAHKPPSDGAKPEGAK